MGIQMDDKELNDEIEKLKAAAKDHADVIEMLTKANKDQLKFVLEFTRLKGKTGKDQHDAAIEMLKKMRESTKSYETLSKSIKETTQQFKDGSISADQLLTSVKTLRGEIERATDKEKRAALMHEKAVLEEANLRVQSGKQFSESLGKIAGAVGVTMVKSFTAAATAAMRGSNALEVGTGLMKAQIDTANAGWQAGANGLSKLGEATAGAGGRIGAMGIIATAAGSAISFLSNSVTELAKAGIDFMLLQTNKMTDGFQVMSAVGATYANGMKGMTETALQAGMTIEQFSKSVASNVNNLTAAGLGITNGSKRMAAAMQAGGNVARDSMFALGMSMEEQGEAYAMTMARLAGPAGKLHASDQQVAAETLEYAKNLKLISDITGASAKEQQAKANERTSSLSMQIELMKMKPEDRAKLKQTMGTMTENDSEALQHRIAGKGSMVDTKTALMESMSPALKAMHEEQYKAQQAGKLDAKENARLRALYSKDIIEDMKKQEQMGAIGKMLPGSSHADLIKSMGDEISTSAKWADAKVDEKIGTINGTTATAAANVGKPGAEGNTAVDLAAAKQDFSLKMQDVANNNLPQFAKALTTTIKSIEDAVAGLADMSAGGGSAIGRLFSIQGLTAIAGSILPTIITYFGIKSLLSKTVLPAAGGTLGGAGADAAGKGLDGLAKGAGEVGKRAGSGFSSVLSGIADGISKFGNPKVLAGAAAVGILAGALWGSAKGFQEFAAVKWQDVGVGLLAVGGLSGVAMLLSAAAVPMIVGAAAVGILAGALWGSAKGFQEFAKVEWNALSTGLVTFGGAIAKFIATAPYMQMLIASPGIAAFGLALIPLATAANILSGTDGGKALQTLGDNLKQFLDNAPYIRILAMVPGILGFGAALLPLAGAIKMLASSNVESLAKLGISLETFLKLVSYKMLKEITPELHTFGKALELFAKNGGDGFERFNKELTKFEKIDPTKIEKLAAALLKVKESMPEERSFWQKLVGSSSSSQGGLLGGKPAAGGSSGASVSGPAQSAALGTGVVAAVPGATTIKNADGSVEKRTGSRNWRNNNPGNIEYGDFAKKHGAVGSDGRFAVFPSYDAGRAAKASLIFEGKNYKDKTLTDAIARYAPPSENNTGNYQKTVLGAIGNQNKRMSEYTTEERNRIMDAMQKVEGFKAGKIEKLSSASSLVAGETGGIPNTNLSRINSGVRSMADQRSEQYNNQQTFYNTAAQNKGVMPVELSGAVGADGKRGRDPLTTGFESIKTVMCKVADLQEQSVGHLQEQLGISDAQRSIAQKAYNIVA